MTLLPTPAAWDGDRGPDYARMRREGSGGDDLVTTIARLLPTPTSRDHKGHNQRADDTCLTGALLPTPRASDGEKGGPNQRGSSGDLMLPAAVQPQRWGAYAAAVARWEAVSGTPAPSPTEQGRNGPRLAPAFVEWLMGLPAGWVTDHLPRNAALKCLGNGVVWQQAAHAYAELLGVAG